MYDNSNLSHFIIIIISCCITAPEAPPVSVTAITNSTTSIIVRWGPPPLNMTNGIIDSYEIRYGQYNSSINDIFSDTVTQSISGNEFEVHNLQEFIEYGFQVRAITVAAGPYSDFATNTTFQAGMCLYTISKIYLYDSLVIFFLYLIAASVGGYSREALGFFMTLLIIIIIAGVVAVILFILYRRNK